MRHRGTKAVAETAGQSEPFPLDPEAWAYVANEMALSPQHERLVACLLRGMRDKQIAQEMDVAVPTIRSYLGRIFSRAGVQDRVELILRVFSIARTYQK